MSELYIASVVGFPISCWVWTEFIDVIWVWFFIYMRRVLKLAY